MKVNVAAPLQLARWLSYLLILLFVELLFIVPLSNLLWMEFANRLVPSGSMSQQLLDSGLNQWDVRFDSSCLTKVSPLGMEPEVRKDIPLVMTINLGMFCTSDRALDSLQLRVGKWSKRLNLVCADNLSLVANRFNGFGSFTQMVKKDLINEFTYTFPIGPMNRFIKIDMVGMSDKHLLEYLNVQFSLKYSGFRQFMLNWKRTCHVLGTLFFASLISSCFLISFTIVFSYIILS